MSLNQIFSIQQIGEGTFGNVCKARKDNTGSQMALKLINIRGVESTVPNHALRELYALRELNHAHVVSLFGAIPSGHTITLLFEYFPFDLSKILGASVRPLGVDFARRILLMLLHALDYCHRRTIIHRDLKPSNLLLNYDGVLKIADFGLARVHNILRSGVYTHQIATRWYRAPELLFGARKYTFSVDMWAVGTIFAEVLNNLPLFAGEGDIRQIYKVVQVLGKPPSKDWYGAGELPDLNKISFPDLLKVGISPMFQNIDVEALELLSALLHFNPCKRATPAVCLRHSFFLNCKTISKVDRPLQTKQEQNLNFNLIYNSTELQLVNPTCICKSHQ